MNLPRINFIKLRRLLLFSIIVLGLFSGGYYVGINGYKLSLTPQSRNIEIVRDIPPGRENVNFSLFWRVWDTLSTSYFDKAKLDPAKMVYGAISGMVDALGDPYTSFLPPQENKVVQEDLSGSFEGVGIQIGFKGTQLAVLAPLPGSPAEAVGVRAGDYIIGIKDEAKNIDRGTVGINLSEAVQIIRGPANSRVTLTLLRDGEEEPRVVDITRRKIEVPSLTLEYLEDGTIAHVKLLKFAGETKGEWDKTVRGLIGRNNLQGIVLDLRNNPGGYMDSAVDIASEFLPNGSLIVTEEKGTGEKIEFKVRRLGLLTKTPVVVIINEGSASASEILAGALRDIAKIQLVGEKSFGKGTIQEPRQLEGGSGLHITIARWLTPSGYWVNEQGLKPDIEVTDDENTEEDEQLQEALKVLKS